MSVLVTGGAGYIGSHTVRALRARGDDVVVLDTLETGYLPALLGTPLVVGDIGDIELVRKTIAEHDVDRVIHFAGYKNAGNPYWSRQVLREQRHGYRPAPAIEDPCAQLRLSGSCSVYGTGTTTGERDGAVTTGEPLRAEQADGRAHVAVVRGDRCAAVDEPALLQRLRRVLRRRDRGRLCAVAEPRSSGDEGNARPATGGRGVRHRLPDARWHGDSRLHTRRGSRRRPPEGPRPPRPGRAVGLGQPRYRHRNVGPSRDRHDRAGDGAHGAGRVFRPPPGRSERGMGRYPPRRRRARLDPEIRAHRDHRIGVAMALDPPGGYAGS